ncbi:hypothetical protein IF1G_02599 [Cordyceps javanica]|uniref:Uncharacterized protein n=1 Tax=Cordyceps javanica TaxID=43265 RepID=A0A545VA88_9HYPO|nr:hypothetical protein IF1G_02599 [Cordyceps javanica]
MNWSSEKGGEGKSLECDEAALLSPREPARGASSNRVKLFVLGINMLVVPLTRAAFPVLPRQPWNWNLEPVTAWIFYINLFQYLTRQVESSANDSAPSVAVPGHLTTKEAHSMKEICTVYKNRV